MSRDVPATAALTGVICDVTVAARAPWSRIVEAGQILRIVDLEGQQAVDFLCYAAHHPADRYSATNTVKIQGNVYVGEGDDPLQRQRGSAPDGRRRHDRAPRQRSTGC